MRSANQTEREPAMVTAPSVTISVVLCKACGICVALCPRGVLVEGAGGVPDVSNAEACTGCRICELHCPDLAISIMDARTASSTADADAG
jgi:2-oxoglutarate ferredoxin oxidoreductase subunit delta